MAGGSFESRDVTLLAACGQIILFVQVGAVLLDTTGNIFREGRNCVSNYRGVVGHPPLAMLIDLQRLDPR